MRLLLAGWTAWAANTDPDLRWRTLKTDHFNIHFHQGIEALADDFSVMAEEVYTEISAEMAWQPRRRTEVVLIDRTDDANGYARTVPYNAITIFVTAPQEDSTLNLYEDWSRAIFVHELTHVLHMDTNHGIVRAARSVVGRVASTNDLSPLWMIEGLATFQETRYTPGGRGRASWPDMIKRTAVLEDAFPPLGNLDGFQPLPPSGNLRYLFGQDFISFVADQQGADVWTRWTHLYGSHLPFLLPTRKAFGERLVPLYFQWREERQRQYTAQAEQIRAQGETLGRVVSLPTASCVAPAYAPDGSSLVWSCYDPAKGSQIWIADGEGYAGQVLLQDRGASYFTWRRDSQAFVYAGTHLVNRFNTYSDVYLHDLKSERTLALTAGARARDPDFAPDGTRLVMVTNKAQQNQLEVLTVDQVRSVLLPADGDQQLSTPRFSPDGAWLAVSVWQHGRRDLWLYTADGEPVRQLTADTAIDADPVWSSDGRWLYFSTDRTGVPNIFAIDLETERLWQVTNVVTGATRASVHPQGHQLAYQRYSQDGWDIVVQDLDPSRFLDHGPLPPPLFAAAPLRPRPPIGEEQVVAADFGGLPSRAPSMTRAGPGAPQRGWSQSTGEVLDSFEDTEGLDLFGQEVDYPFRITPRRYSPFATLLPRYVAPFVQTSPFPPRAGQDFTCLGESFCPSLLATLATGSADALSRYGWNAFATYGTDSGFLGAGGNLVIDRWLPIFSVGANTRAVSPTRYVVTNPSDPTDPNLYATDERYWERRITTYAQVSFPYRLRSSVFANYSLTHRTNLDPIPSNAYLPLIPLRGTLGALSGGYRFAWSQQTPLSISLEDARVLSLVGKVLLPQLGTRVLDPTTGEPTPLSQLQLTGELREYVVNPWVPNHVLAGRVGTGLAVGGTQFLGNYQLGGNFGENPFYVTPDEFRMLRGYPFGYDIGDLYWLGSLEYRFPIWQIQRGLGTLPVFARYLSGSAFLDAGNAFANPLVDTGPGQQDASDLLTGALADPLVSVGAEVSLATVVLWGGGLTGRFGYALPLAQREQLEQPNGQAYLQLGGSF